MKSSSILNFARRLVPVLCLMLQIGHAQRPREPWLFEGSLEGRPGMVFLALHQRMTVAYDREGCSVYLAWQGPAALEAGPAPAGTGPEYRAAGPVYQKRANPSPWSVMGPKGNVPVTARLAAAAADGGKARLDYVLSLPGGAKIKVRETPEFDDHYGDAALFRTFEVTGIPAGMALRLEVGGRGMAETWGGGAMGRVIREGDRYFLLQELDGETPLKVSWSPLGASEIKDGVTKPKNPTK